ncbi:MAG: hypothetical protein ACE5GJ_02695 [Gemmatimonadota bacterium]
MKRIGYLTLLFTALSWTTLLSGRGPAEGSASRSADPAADFPRGADPAVHLSTASDPTADSLVSRWIEALGGMDTYARLRSARYTLTTEIWDAASGRLRRARPRYVAIQRTPRGDLARIERWEGNDFIQHGWDGERAWAFMNGKPLGPGDKDYDQVRYVTGDVNYWIGLPFKLKDPGVNLHLGGTDEGRTLVTVSFGEGVGLHDGDTWRYWFEEGRTWPVQVAYREEGRSNWNVLRFEDIRTVDGYVFVGRRVHIDEEGRVTKVLRTSDFELNPEFPEGYFSGPEVDYLASTGG